MISPAPATIWLFAHPIDPATSRDLANPVRLEESAARRLLAASDYTIDAPRWVISVGLLADEDPTHREHAIRRGGALYGWLTVEEEPPADVAAARRQEMAEWARGTLAELLDPVDWEEFCGSEGDD